MSGRARVALAVVALLVATATAERAMGRALVYQHGPVRLWSGEVKSDQSSQQVADPYSLTHLEHGAVLYGLASLALGGASVATRFLVVAAVECTWEVLENTDAVVARYRAETISLDYFGDSVLNSICDVLCCLAGFGLARRLPVWATSPGSSRPRSCSLSGSATGSS